MDNIQQLVQINVGFNVLHLKLNNNYSCIIITMQYKIENKS